MSPWGELGDRYVRPLYVVVLQFLINLYLFQTWKLKNKNFWDIHCLNTSWALVFASWPFWVWRVCPFMKRMAAWLQGANTWNNMTSAGKVRSESHVELGESGNPEPQRGSFGNPWSPTGKNLPLRQPGPALSDTSLPQEVLPFPSTLHIFYKADSHFKLIPVSVQKTIRTQMFEGRPCSFRQTC